MARRKEPVIADSLLDQLLAGADAQTAFEQNGLLDQHKKALAERALNAEMDHQLGSDNGVGNGGNCWPNISGGSPASTTRLSRCMRGA